MSACSCNARSARAPSTSTPPTVAGGGVTRGFTADELATMYRLEHELAGERSVAKRMTEFLPNKTNVQIRSQRCEPAYKRERDAYLAQVRLRVASHATGEPGDYGSATSSASIQAPV